MMLVQHDKICIKACLKYPNFMLASLSFCAVYGCEL